MINFNDVIDILLGNTPVEQVSDSRGNVLWSSAPVVLPNYFYVEDTSGQANTLRILKGGGGSAPTVEVFCSTDRVNWTSMGSTSTTPITATVPANGKLYLKANTERFGGGWDGENNINCNASFNVGGNIMSMLNGDNFEGSTFAPNTTHNFGCMFKWSNVVDASNLVLPDTVTSYCYWGCFYGCTSLTTAPALPATIMAEECYNAMFNGCGSLTTTPALPATTLANNCYFGMFDGCASLTTAPVLPATTLATGCYGFMFNGCASLTTAPALPATTLANGCYQSMFKSCTSLTTAPVLPATTMANNCYQAMFYGCSSLTTTPALPATTLASSCYEGMFWNCGSLTSAPATLPVTTLYAYCYANMFNSCGSLTTAPALPATTLATGCYRNMFNSCASLTTAPELPATTLTSYCYRWMFQGCSRLNRIVTYAQDISAEGCLDNWLSNVAATGDFYNYGEATYTSGASGIPTGWTEHTPPNYFYVEDTSGAANTLSITKRNANAPTVEVFSSRDRVNWTSMGNTDTTAITATIPANGKLYIKATTNGWAYDGNTYNRFYFTKSCNIGGNIMSLLYGDDFEHKTTFPSNSDKNFMYIFYDNMYLRGSENLILPATTLTGSCYNRMFYGCQFMTTAPRELPATTLATGCYTGMLENCRAITTAPALPATTLASGCYAGMFSGCTSLTTAPALPANTLANTCYSNMFSGCTSLTTAPALPATTLAQYCYQGMFNGCTSLTTAPALPATTLTKYCYSIMFWKCTSLTTAPALPATTLTQGCYDQMFLNCSNLNNVTTYADNISASDCLYNWLSNVAATGDFYNYGTATYTSGTSGIPTGWTEHKWYNVTIVAGNNGSVRVNGVIGNYIQRVQSGTVLTIEGIPNNGYLFSTWSDGNTANPRTVTVNSNLYLSSTFAAVPNYMYVEDVSGTANTLKIAKDNNSAPAIDLYYSADAVNWTSMGNPSTTGFTTTIPANGRVYLKATADRWGNGGQRNYITANNNYNVGGNIMSLLYGDNFEGQTALPSGVNYHFDSLFRNDTHLVSAEDLSMPATTLGTYCYQEMFEGCTSLTTAPKLPATTLTDHCYQAMFQGCTSLNNVRVSANDISALQCTTDWLANVAATGDFYNYGTATYTVDSADGIPQGWTEHKGIPDEYFWIENPSNRQITMDITTEGAPPAITLYYSTDKVNWQQSSGWVDIEPQSKVYMKANTDKWAIGIADYNHFDSLDDEFNVGGNIMSLLYGDNYKDVTTFGTNNTYAFTGLFYGSKVVDASQLKLPTNTVSSCYNRMFYNCSQLMAAPALPATTLNGSCYNNMFNGCTLLNKIVSYAEDASVATLKTNKWLNAVSSTGDFYNLGNAGYSSGVSGIPTGWTVHTSL